MLDTPVVDGRAGTQVTSVLISPDSICRQHDANLGQLCTRAESLQIVPYEARLANTSFQVAIHLRQSLLSVHMLMQIVLHHISTMCLKILLNKAVT